MEMDNYQSRSSVQIETDGSKAVSDEGDDHYEDLYSARPISEVRSVILKWIQLPLQMFVALHHRVAQRASGGHKNPRNWLLWLLFGIPLNLIKASHPIIWTLQYLEINPL